MDENITLQTQFDSVLSLIKNRPDPAQPTADDPATERIGNKMAMWPEDAAAMPTEMTRVALFGLLPDKLGARQFLEDAPIASRSDVEVLYTGRQLNAKDETAWLAVLRLGRGIPMGQRIYFNKVDLLRECGLSNTGPNWKVLQNRLKRLSNAHFEIRFKRNGKTGQIHTGLMGWGIEEESAAMFIRLHPEGAALFENLAYQPWAVRLALRSDASTRLLTYVCGHTQGKPHAVLLDDLRQWLGYNGRLRQFRVACHRGLDDLEAAGVLMTGSIKFSKGPRGEVVSWIRSKSTTTPIEDSAVAPSSI